jgi:NDP-sugar pyrophosphorylase family protein
MVMAAGLGTRMRPLTLLKAKPVMPVLNRPLLHWTLELLARHGFTDLVVNLHHRSASVREAVGDGRRFGVNIQYSVEREILGTSGGPRKMRSFFGDEPFLVVNGDVVFDFDLGRLMTHHRDSRARATLALLPNPDPRRYGAVVTGPDGLVRALAGYPRRARGTPHLFTGIHVMDPAILDRLPLGPSDTVRDLYAPLIAEGQPIAGVRLKGAWYDLGSPQLYLASHRSLLARGFRGLARGSLVDPGAIVHPGARLVAAVVGKGCVVGEGAEVRGSVLWEGVKVASGARVRDSIMATGTSVGSGQQVTSAVVMRAADAGAPRTPTTRQPHHVVEIEQ